MKLVHYILSLTLFSLSLSGFAFEDEKVILTQCLLERTDAKYKVIKHNKHFALISLDRANILKLGKDAHQQHHCGKFINVSHDYATQSATKILADYTEVRRSNKTITPYTITHEKSVRKLIGEIDSQHLWSQLKYLTSFKNRYSDSHEGVLAIQWVKDTFDKMAKDNHRDDTSSYFVATKHPRYKQPSLVTVIGKNIKADAVIVGAHIDTYPDYMQGADDDGTGSANNLELARLLLSTKTRFKHPIYIIWYAAEEMGLVGSQNVVRDFEVKQIPVKAVMQIDMSGYNSANNDIYLVRDYTDNNLDDFMEKLITTYTSVQSHDMYCHYACSDHASWYQHHVKSVMPFEADLNAGNASPYIHTSQDTLDTVSLTHMLEFLKLSIAFVGELGEAF